MDIWYGNHLENRVVWYAWKFLLGCAVCAVVAFCYFNASQLTAHRSYDLSLFIDRAIPFLPWTWWIYFPGYLAGLIFGIFAIRDLSVYYRTLVAILIGQTICTIIFFLLPSTFPRPMEAGLGWTGDAIRWFWTIDPANNTFPSKHVTIVLLAAAGMWADRNPLRWISGLFALGVVITVHTARQHYLVDTLAGMLVAWFSFWLVFYWWPRRQQTMTTLQLIKNT